MARRRKAPRKVLYCPPGFTPPRHVAEYRHKREVREPTWYIVHLDTERSCYAPLEREDIANQALAEYLIDARRDERAPDLLISEVLLHYCEERPHDPDKRFSDRQRQRWIASTRSRCKRLLPVFGHMQAHELSVHACRNYHTKRTADGAAPETVRRELGLLRAALGWAVARGRLPVLPAVWCPAQHRVPRPMLSRSDVARILLSARRERQPEMARAFCLLVRLMIHTGHRYEAVMDLKFAPWRDGGYIDNGRGLIDFNRGDGHRTSKGRSRMRVPRRLRVAMLAAERRSASGFAIDCIRCRWSYREAWVRILARAGLAATRKSGGYTFHDLIHHGITERLRAGGSVWHVASHSGRSEKMVRDVYGHWIDDEFADADR